MRQKYEVIFFTNGSSRPVQKFIASLSKNTHSKISRAINVLEAYGPDIGMPRARRMSNNLWELRIKGLENIRFFYCAKNESVILLHGFKKKTQKTPAKELEIAKKRLTHI